MPNAIVSTLPRWPSSCDELMTAPRSAGDMLPAAARETLTALQNMVVRSPSCGNMRGSAAVRVMWGVLVMRIGVRDGEGLPQA